MSSDRRRRSGASSSAAPNSSSDSPTSTIGSPLRTFKPVCAVSSSSERMQRDLCRTLRERVLDPAADAHPLLDLPQQAFQIEHHGAALRRHRRAPALEHDHELRMRRTVGVGPQLLRARTGERLLRRALRQVAQRAGGGPGERLQPGRQRLLELRLDVDVGVQLVDEERRDLVADLAVLEQLRTRLGPVVGVDDLPVGPQGDDRREREHGRDQHKGDRAIAAAAAGAGGLAGGLWLVDDCLLAISGMYAAQGGRG